MYHNEEELLLLETITKGRKSKFSSKLESHFNQDKYKFYKRSFNDTRDFRIPSTEDMLHTASRKTQAIFKISSFGKGTKRIAAHLSYISRRSKLELEDHIGNKILTLQDQKEKLEAWAFDFGDGERVRNTMQIVLSTPPGTNPDIALRAAKEFLEKEYKQSGHEYLFVQHRNTSHPHVHAVIKMLSCHGNKINPRKAYLHSVRQHFAAICRSYGIQVEASSRAERGLAGHSLKSEFVHMQRGEKKPKTYVYLASKIRAELPTERYRKYLSGEKIDKRNQIIKKRYADKARELAQKSQEIVNEREKENYNKKARLLYKHIHNLHQKVEVKDKKFNCYLEY